jgi:hypothetical protein
MRLHRTVISVLATATALLGAAQAPALGDTNAAPTISISAKSSQPKVTGYIWVIFQGGATAHAHIKGTVTGATSGQVLRLFAQRFPFKKAPARLFAPVTLNPTGTSTPYSFQVTPTLATRYTVQLFADANSATPLVKSAVQVVFVAANGHASGVRTCNRPGQRPVCHQRIHLRVIVPPSTLRTERAKAWKLYFGLRLDSSGAEPPPPRRLKLGGGHARVLSTRKVSAQRYDVTVAYSFRVGNDGYFFAVNLCQRDTVGKDGLNLPGYHGCGNTWISTTVPYLG